MKKKTLKVVLSATMALSTLCSARVLIVAKEKMDLSLGLKNNWNFDNVKSGDTKIPSSNDSSVVANLFGNHVSIVKIDNIFGNVLRFTNANDSYMKMNDYINTGTSSTSFSMWYRYDTTISDAKKDSVLFQQDGSGKTLLTLKASGKYQTYANAQNVVSNQAVSKGVWQHVTITLNQATRKTKFYINGILDSEQTLGANSVNAKTALLIGSHKNIGNTDPQAMKGDIDDIRIYSKVISDEEAKAIYEEKASKILKEELKKELELAQTLYDSGKLSETADAAISLKAGIECAKEILQMQDAAFATIQKSIQSLKKAIQIYKNNMQITLTVDANKVNSVMDSSSIFGINHRYAFNGYGSFDEDNMRVKKEFTDLYKNANFGSIRYPGGTISNLFNWKTAIGPKEKRKDQIHGFYNNRGQKGIKPNFGLSEIGTFAKEVNSEIVYVYSLGRGNAQDASDLVEYLNAKVGTNPNGGIDWAAIRAANGHKDPFYVRYFEIGNEMQQASAAGDGTTSQGYWTTGVAGGSEKAYTEGGVASFTKQYAVDEEDWNKEASRSDGRANMIRFMRYANVNPKMYDEHKNVTNDPSFIAVNKESVRIYVGDDASNEEWTIVDSFQNASSTDKVAKINTSNGSIQFGDGVHGKIPEKGRQIFVSYRVDRQGFIDVSKAIKQTTDKINEIENTNYVANVYTSYESRGFIQRMDTIGVTKWYDGMTIHPYSGRPIGTTPREWYNSAMKLAETNGIDHVKTYVAMLPEGKVPVISEYGIYNDTNTMVRSQTHALYIAKVIMEYVRLGSPYIQKHCLVDYYSSGGDSLGPTQQAVIQAVPQAGSDIGTGKGEFQFFSTPSAHVFKMLNSGFGDEIMDTSFHEVPLLENGVKSLSAIASKDANGNMYIGVLNVDLDTSKQIELVFTGIDATGFIMDVQTLAASSFRDENTIEDPNKVQVEHSMITADRAQPILTLPAHSFTLLKIRAKNPSINSR